MKKQCFKCKKEKPLREFYVHKQMSDGHLGKCKKCTKADVQKRYQDPESKKRIQEYERLRFQDPERKRKTLEYQRIRRARYKGKDKARAKVGKAIKMGTLIKKSCEVCGNPKSEAHHLDYRKALNIKWLCFKHHRELHGQIVN